MDSMCRVLVTGADSFLGQALLRAWPKEQPIVPLAYPREPSAAELGSADWLVNFAIAPEYRSRPYEEELDIDLRFAERARTFGLRYLMVSSRKVYAPSAQRGAYEGAPVCPWDAYGRNKLETEQRLLRRLGDQLTVVRVANVIGIEQRLRRSFMSLVMNGLARDGTVVFDVSPQSRRDFVPDTVFGRVLARLLLDPEPGVFNLGTGIPTTLGEIASWVIEGYGRGAVRVTDPEVRDEFWLDVGKLTARYGAVCPKDEIRRRCVEIGGSIEPE